MQRETVVEKRAVTAARASRGFGGKELPGAMILHKSGHPKWIKKTGSQAKNDLKTETEVPDT